MIQYLSILRPNHWSKNSIALAGFIIALIALQKSFTFSFFANIILLLIALGLISSGNYIMNDLLDKEQDLKHPLKRERIITSGKISRKNALVMMLSLYIVSFIISLLTFNLAVNLGLLIFLLQAITYNVPPIRIKDIAFLDVISESFNSPIRFYLGWALVSSSFPPLSILFFWWAYTGVLMVAKRLAEYRYLGKDKSKEYRKIFYIYTENSLRYSILIYIALTIIFTAFIAFLVNNLYQIVTIMVLIQLVWYYRLADRGDKAVQKPVYIYKDKLFTIYSFLILIITILIGFKVL